MLFCFVNDNVNNKQKPREKPKTIHARLKEIIHNIENKKKHKLNKNNLVHDSN